MSFNGGILLGSIAEMRRGEGTVVRVRKHGVVALFAATGVAAGIMAAPIAFADTCDPAVAVCQGGAHDCNQPPHVSGRASAQQVKYLKTIIGNPSGMKRDNVHQ